jgi:hypothetical protein
MIQAANIQHIEPKALKGVKGQAKEEASAVDAESGVESKDFASELMASLAVEDIKVKPVEVSVEQALEQPSALINMPEAGIPEVSPKIFDPALTQGVEKLIQPATTDGTPAKLLEAQVAMNGEVPVLDGEVNSELTQALLKTPQVNAVQTGRSPAIDFAQSEVDPQLMNMEDFVAQKNLVKKNVQPNAYGLKSPQTKIDLETGLKQTQVVKETTGLEGQASGPMNSQQFILNMMNEQNGSAQVNEVAAPVKVFEMSQIKTDNPNQIMTQITDYIVQAKAAKEPTVNMRVNHEQLGMIDITVQKAPIGQMQDAIAINIGAHSVDGKNFFQQNSKDLFAHLTQAGLNVSDLKVETPSQTAKNNFDMGQQSSGRQGSGQDKQFGSEQNQRRHDSERRQDLWNLLKDKEAA